VLVLVTMACDKAARWRGGGGRVAMVVMNMEMASVDGRVVIGARTAEPQQVRKDCRASAQGLQSKCARTAEQVRKDCRATASAQT
jgi:hypothetical protein